MERAKGTALIPYRMELNQQARDGLDCREWMSDELGRLHAGKRGDPHIRRFWIHARGLLTACASTSLILWPSPAGKRDLAEISTTYEVRAITNEDRERHALAIQRAEARGDADEVAAEKRVFEEWIR